MSRFCFLYISVHWKRKVFLKQKFIFAGIVLLLLITGEIIALPRLLPSLSSVFSALETLYSSYDLLFHSFYSITTVVSNLIISNIILSFLMPAYIGSRLQKGELKLIPVGIISVGIFFTGLYILFVFPLQHLALSVMLFPVSLVLSYNNMVNELNGIRGSMGDFYTSLTGDRDTVYVSLAGSLMKGRIFTNIHDILNSLWMWLLLFEFLSDYGKGLGYLIKIGYEYWSLPVMTAALLYTVAFIWLANLLMDVLIYAVKLRRLKG